MNKTDQPFYDWEKTLDERDKDLVKTAFDLMLKQLESFRKDFPLKPPDAPKDYQCVLLDVTKTLCHIENTVMLETDSLPDAVSFVYNLFHTHGIECAVYQPANNCYREYYRNEE